MTTTRLKPAYEADCQRTIIDAAKRGGWLVHAERTSMSKSGRYMTAIQGDPGFPDLVLAHPRRGLYFVELKRKPNKIEPAQQRWLDVLDDVLALGAHIGIVYAAQVWWVPDELDARVEWLVTG